MPQAMKYCLSRCPPCLSFLLNNYMHLLSRAPEHPGHGLSEQRTLPTGQVPGVHCVLQTMTMTMTRTRTVQLLRYLCNFVLRMEAVCDEIELSKDASVQQSDGRVTPARKESSLAALAAARLSGWLSCQHTAALRSVLLPSSLLRKAVRNGTASSSCFMAVSGGPYDLLNDNAPTDAENKGILELFTNAIERKTYASWNSRQWLSTSTAHRSTIHQGARLPLRGLQLINST